MSDYAKILARCPLFEGELNGHSAAAVDGFETRSARKGEKVMAKGDSSEEILVVLEGSLGLVFDRGWGQERIVETIRPGGMAGDVELLNGERCLADVRALEDSVLLPVKRREFEQLLEASAGSWDTISDHARSRTCRLMITRHLCELFGISDMAFSDPGIRQRAEQEWLEFENDILVQLEAESEWVTLRRGQFLFRQGDKPDGAYVLVSGSLRVGVSDGEGGEKAIARIRQGEILGEMALITDDNRSASISALRDCELFRLPAELFTAVSERYPRNVLSVYRTVTRRFGKSLSGRAYREKTENIAFLPASPEQDISAFVQSFMQELERYDTVEKLSRKSVDMRLGHEGIAISQAHEPANLRLVQWLNGHELDIGHLLYQGDSNWSEWTERCIRQSDKVVVVAEAGSTPDFSRLQGHLEDAGIGWSLVILHPGDTRRPTDTAALVRGAPVDAILHARKGRDRDMARLVRILSGRAVSLVLGGGGARGFAHLGVLRALEELGVDVDMVGGTSIGAPIAGWLAQGKNANECQAAASSALKSLIDVTLPTTSLLAGKRISEMICQQTASWDIEDYWLPYFCVSTNLTASRVEVHRRGNSARAIRSSVSIPGVLPPVPNKGELLVDGGVLNNLPVNVMREMNPSGTVIAIDVVLPRSFSAEEDYGLNVSGWRQLLARFMPGIKGSRTPSLANVIVQSMMVGSSRSRERKLQQAQADFYQNIHVHGVGILQFEALEQAASIGYSESIEPLREWLAGQPSTIRPAEGSRQKHR
ncbi:MAG: cyclic nucleotide-binding and patatin-like phospholipase domain-containing protein [Xanthomonadales bacterium]|jgi:predicted acylesterase/phospholipase RssA/CRP-like cAMP-binding protein|nr:cyclic nucleotide-binding and patatin-like phospholipase domain-containing protein [Xanthomonadales bacterium]